MSSLWLAADLIYSLRSAVASNQVQSYSCLNLELTKAARSIVLMAAR